MFNFFRRMKARMTNRVWAKYSKEWTPLTGEVEVFGEKHKFRNNLQEDGTVLFSSQDIANMSIKCAWCGEPILVGSLITLLSPKETYEIPEHAVRYEKEGHLQLVGCLRDNCSDSMDRAGYWVPNTDEPEKREGKVYRVLSPMEIVMLNMSHGDDSPVIIGDISDPNEALQLSREAIQQAKNTK